MKFKVLKDFISSVGNFFEGKHHDVELDEPTATMWTEHGLIAEVKEESDPEAGQPENNSPEPESSSSSSVVEAPPDSFATVTPAAEAVTADETK